MKQNPTLVATCVLMVIFLSYTTHVRAAPYLRNDLLGANEASTKDVNIEAIKNRALKQTSKSNDGSFFSFVNTGTHKMRALRRASTLPSSAVTPKKSCKSTSSPGIELVERIPRASVGGNNTEGSNIAASGDEVPSSQQVHPTSRPKHAKLTRDKARRLSRLLELDVNHAAFDQSTSTGIWSALGAKDGLRREDSFMKDSKRVPPTKASSFLTSKKFFMVSSVVKRDWRARVCPSRLSCCRNLSLTLTRLFFRIYLFVTFQQDYNTMEVRSLKTIKEE